MQCYDWPGNIRELENFIRRALALTQGTALGVDLFGSVAQVERSFACDAAKTRSDPAGSGTLASGSDATRHQRQSHSYRRNDGREPAHRAQQDPRIRAGGRGRRYELDQFGASLDLLRRFLDLSSKRQELITSNIANVDTPGYHAKDIDFQGELAARAAR